MTSRSGFPAHACRRKIPSITRAASTSRASAAFSPSGMLERSTVSSVGANRAVAFSSWMALGSAAAAATSSNEVIGALTYTSAAPLRSGRRALLRAGTRSILRASMRLGIDFGTTNTAVALVDRGNYPVVSFEHGDSIPSLVAASADASLRFGHHAAAVAHDAGWTVVRSFKRLLEDAGPHTEVQVGPVAMRLSDLLTSFFEHVRDQLRLHSNAH